MRNNKSWTRIARNLVVHPTTLEVVMRAAERMAARRSKAPADDLLDQALDIFGLKRKEGAASQVGSTLPWLTIGAALGAGALMASPAARPIIDNAFKQSARWASEGWDQSVDMAESFRSQAIAVSDDALAQVGLQRRRSIARQIAMAGAWIGVGVAVGAAASMYVKVSSKNERRKDEHAAPPMGNSQARGDMAADNSAHPM